MKKLDIIYLALPLVLWPLSFILLSGIFIYAMTCSTLLLAAITIYKYRDVVFWKAKKLTKPILYGLAGAVILYLIFLAGYYLTLLTGTVSFVDLVYTTIYANAPTVLLALCLLVIGVCEETYWRGGVLGLIKKKYPKNAWLIAALYYSLVHLSTLNPILVLAAFFVGIIASFLADRYGILSSIIAHVVWIEAIIIFLPVLHI